jgi:polyhydroxybutyrate depolymerase
MKRFVATLMLLLAASPASGQGQILDRSLIHDGISRNYTIYVPSSYTPLEDAPLVLNMHGLTLNRGFQMSASGMNAVAEQEGFLVVYPDAVNGDWFGPQDNVGFIDGLLEAVSSDYSVDASKIYASGFSQGGAMSYILSVERPHTFAAIASVGGPRGIAFGDTLFPPDVAATPSRPFPLLHMHGTSDALVPYNGGAGVFNLQFPSVESVVSDFVLNNGGNLTPTVADLPDTNSMDGSTAQLFSYDGGVYFDTAGNPREAEVLLYRIQNGGHNWPGDFTGWPDWASLVNRDFNASAEIWNFFSRHAVAAIPEPAGIWLVCAGVATCAVRFRRRRQNGSANVDSITTLSIAIVGCVVLATSANGAVIVTSTRQLADVEIEILGDALHGAIVEAHNGRAHADVIEGDRFTPSESKAAARSSAVEMAANASFRHRTGRPFQRVRRVEAAAHYDLHGLVLGSGPVDLEFFLPPGFIEIESNAEARDSVLLDADIVATIAVCRPDCEASAIETLFRMESRLAGGWLTHQFTNQASAVNPNLDLAPLKHQNITIAETGDVRIKTWEHGEFTGNVRLGHFNAGEKFELRYLMFAGVSSSREFFQTWAAAAINDPFFLSSDPLPQRELFRLVQVPEPSAFALVAICSLVFVAVRR